MAGTQHDSVNPSILREQFGPAPWWSREHLDELVNDRGLSAAEIASIWTVHPSTVRDAIKRWGLRDD